MNPSGLWKGILHNRVGTFKFINVEMLSDKGRSGRQRPGGKYSHHCSSSRGKPQTVEELLRRINLEVITVHAYTFCLFFNYNAEV